MLSGIEQRRGAPQISRVHVCACLNEYLGGIPVAPIARIQMDKRQKEDVELTFGKTWKGLGDLDYVCCWYKKANDYIQNTETRCAFVSTNSITQGGAVANLWKPLFADGVHIDFAYRTFKWASESLDMAHVHCVIVGFSVSENNKPKIIFDENGNRKPAENINGYLLDMPNVFIESRGEPICDVPGIGIGNKPIDGGFYLFAEPEMKAFIKKEPASAKYFHPWIGSEEFIKGNKRWCLWLGDVPPAELFKMPECLKRVQAVREYRLRSTSAPTRKLADKPTRFHVENFPKGNYIVIPEVSSEKRKYIPIGFLTPDIFCSNLVKIIPDGFWSYAALQPSMATNHAWKFSPIGTSRLDESASPASNAKSAQQIFDAPKDAQCAAFFRSDKLPSPDLADAEGWFRYSFEKGQLMVHWKTLKAVVQFETRWNVDFCDKGCGAAGQGPRAVEATKAQMTDFPELSPAFDLRLNNVAILGFPVPTIKNVASTGNIISVRIPALKKAQADLLYRDALSFSKSARDDLLGGAMITGLLDAALQLDPEVSAGRSRVE